MDEAVLRPERKASFYIARISGLLLLLAMSATFFYSAYTKCGIEFHMKGWLPQVVETPATANAFDSFQWTFLDLGINSIFVSGVIARLMIGMEVLLGLFLLFHIFLRQFTYKAVIGVLSVFIIYLLIVIIKQGNAGNCGCFGNSVSMTPLQAIIKNVIMIGVTVLLMFIYPVKPYKYQEYWSMLLALIAFSSPFVVNVMYTGTAPEKYEQTVDLNLLYKFDEKPQVELRKGKHIVAFMSLTCPHCKKAAYLLQVIHREHPELSIYMVLDGAEEHMKAFFDETHAEHVPYIYYHHKDEFLQLAGPGVPSIYWVNNGVVEYKSRNAYYQLDPSFMKKWVGKP